jgi:hypothetical protein
VLRLAPIIAFSLLAMTFPRGLGDRRFIEHGRAADE